VGPLGIPRGKAKWAVGLLREHKLGRADKWKSKPSIMKYVKKEGERDQSHNEGKIFPTK